MSYPSRMVVLTAALLSVESPTAGAGEPWSLGGFSVNAVMQSGDPVPGVDGKNFSGFFSAPQIDNAGNVAFKGLWESPGVPGGEAPGLFYGAPNAVNLVAQGYTPAPGIPFSPPPWNYFHVLPQAAVSHLSEGGFMGLGWNVMAGPQVAYAGQAPDIELVAYGGYSPDSSTPGMPAPGLPGFWISGAISPLVNSAGQVALVSSINNTRPPPVPQMMAVYTGTAGNLTPVAYTGANVPTLPGVNFAQVNIDQATLNEAGQLGFMATLQGDGVTPDNSFAIFRHSARGTEVLAREGDAVPALGNGVTFLALYSGHRASLAESGTMQFTAFVQGPGIDASNDLGVWLGTPGDLSPVLREGDTTRGLEPGVTVSSFIYSRISESGNALLYGRVAGSSVSNANDEVLWYGSPDLLSIVLREGDQAPGLPDDVVLDFNNYSLDSTVNEAGDMLLKTKVAGLGIDASNDLGLWYREGDTGVISLLLRSGDLFDGKILGPASFSVVDDSGRGSSIADDGSFAVVVSFADSTQGVYQFAVPEPSCVWMACSVAWLVPCRRRRA